MLVGGAWVDPLSGVWFESVNPFTAAPWALIPRGGKEDVDRAVAAAKDAFYGNAWRGMTASARGGLLRRLGDLVAGEARRLAEIETLDNGKLLAELQMQLQTMRTKPFVLPTARSTAWRRAFGRRASAARWSCPSASKRARFG